MSQICFHHWDFLANIVYFTCKPMTTYVFIYNLTDINFNLYDNDNNFFGLIKAHRNYSKLLNYSDTFQKQYNLISIGITPEITLSFYLNINGEVARVTGSPQTFLLTGGLTCGGNIPQSLCNVCN